MPYDKNSLIFAIRDIAKSFELPQELVCAVVEQESNFNTCAIRYEAGFYKKYVEPQNITDPTEARARSISWGLMQIMGQVARELGFQGSLAQLCEPVIGLTWGCKKLAQCLKLTSSKGEALQRWNGGGNPLYAQEVLLRATKYMTVN